MPHCENDGNERTDGTDGQRRPEVRTLTYPDAKGTPVIAAGLSGANVPTESELMILTVRVPVTVAVKCCNKRAFIAKDRYLMEFCTIHWQLLPESEFTGWKLQQKMDMAITVQISFCFCELKLNMPLANRISMKSLE